MFVARKHELGVLERLYARGGFEMVVIYGRRRVGKTALIDEFVKDKPTLYFTALQQSNRLNLRDFTAAVADFFGLPSRMPPFPGWRDAMRFVADQARTRAEPFVFVFDEFPYAVDADESLPSVLQIAIDHGFKDANVMIVLSGSNEGFMESRVLGGKSPLYGRRTAQIRLRPFDYLDAAEFIPGVDAETAVEYYATFGGTPYYLARVNKDAGYERNVFELCFDSFGLLHEEPMMLLREELREPAVYYSVLQSMASGNATPKAIAEHAGVAPEAMGAYLKTLDDLGLVERRVPFGDNPAKSRKGMWTIADPFFAYWFRFVGPYGGLIESGHGERAARRVAMGDAFATYVGQQFETVCLQWVKRMNGGDAVPLLATRFGKWWGNNPRRREQTDIDVVAGDPASKTLLIGECKWRNAFNESKAVEALRERAGLIDGYASTHLMLFSKRPVSEATRANNPDVTFLSAADLYGAPGPAAGV